MPRASLAIRRLPKGTTGIWISPSVRPRCHSRGPIKALPHCGARQSFPGRFSPPSGSPVRQRRKRQEDASSNGTVTDEPGRCTRRFSWSAAEVITGLGLPSTLRLACVLVPWGKHAPFLTWRPPFGAKPFASAKSHAEPSDSELRNNDLHAPQLATNLRRSPSNKLALSKRRAIPYSGRVQGVLICD